MFKLPQLDTKQIFLSGEIDEGNKLLLHLTQWLNSKYIILCERNHNRDFSTIWSHLHGVLKMHNDQDGQQINDKRN